MSASEVAQLRQQIDQEIAASKLAMTGYAEVARHDVITYHYGTLSGYLDQLKVQVGDQAAMEILVQALEDQL